MILYKIVNKINGKMYIGKTCQTIKQRWNRHMTQFKRNTNRVLYAAMRKYGLENFQIIKILQCQLLSELDILQKRYIQQFKTLDRQFGYNMIPGGPGGGRMPPQSIQKMRQKKIGMKPTKQAIENVSKALRRKYQQMRDNGIKIESHLTKQQREQVGKKLSKKWKTDIQWANHMKFNNHMNGKTGQNHHFFGKNHTAQSKEKIKNANIGKKGSDNQKQWARHNFTENNPRFKYVDIVDIIKNISDGQTISSKYAQSLGMTRQGLRYKIFNVLKIKSANQMKGQAIKWLFSQSQQKK